MIIPSLFTESFLWPPSDLTDVIFWRTSVSIFLNLSSSKLISWSFLIDLFIFAFNCLQRFFCLFVSLFNACLESYILIHGMLFVYLFVYSLFIFHPFSVSTYFCTQFIVCSFHLFIFTSFISWSFFFELFVWTSPDLTARMFWWTIYHSESLWFQNNLCFSFFIQCMSWIICFLFTDYF